MRILVTGANGFLGSHLCKAIEGSVPTASLIRADRPTDLGDRAQVRELLLRENPDVIFNFVGLARVSSEIGFEDYLRQNFFTTETLVREIQSAGLSPRIFFASTVHVYGNQPQEITEASEVRPQSAYAFTKYLAENLLRESKLPVVITRLYSCFGVGQGEGFVTADFCKRLAHLPENGGELQTGPLDPVRQFLDAADLARILVKLLQQTQQERCEVFNIASPHRQSIRELLETLLKVSGKTPRIRESRNDLNTFKGLNLSTRKLELALGQFAFTPLETTLSAMYAHALRAQTA